VRIGIHYANFTHPSWDTTLLERLTETARVADQGGAAWLTVMDHYFQMENLGGPSEPMLEGYTTLGYLAAQTSNVKLSLLVTGATYRHPGLLAKIVTTLDVLSGGRAWLGVGAGYHEEEAQRVLRPIEKFLKRHDIAFTLRWTVGTPGQEIVRAAKKEKAHMIVMGTHGHGLLGRALLGSVAQNVLTQCDVPVLLVK